MLKKIGLITYKITRNIVFTVFIGLIVLFGLVFIWSNIKFRPFKINDTDNIEKISITLSFIKEDIRYEFDLPEQEQIQSFVNELNEIRAKKIPNPGGGNEKTKISISIDYKSEYKGKDYSYIRLYGPQILLSMGSRTGYKLELEDSDEFIEFVKQIYEAKN